jgi:hypothetical protein
LTEVRDIYRRFVGTTYFQTLTSDDKLHFLQDIGRDLLDKLQIADDDRALLPLDNPGHLEEAAADLLKCFNTLPSSSPRDINFLSRWRGTYVPKLSFMFVCIQEQRLFDQYSGELDEFGQKYVTTSGGQYGGDGGIVSVPVLITLFLLLLVVCITLSIATRGLGCVLLLAMAGGGRWWGSSNKASIEEENAKVAKMFVILLRDVFNDETRLIPFLTAERKFSRVFQFVMAFFTSRPKGIVHETHPDCVYVTQGIRLLEKLDPDGNDARMHKMKLALQSHLTVEDPSCQQTAGTRKTASRGKWTTTGRKVRVKVRGAFLERSVYRNSATGEMRVRKQSTRPDGSRKFTYVKF